MNSTKQRLMTLLLAFLMIITSLPLNVFAASGASGDKKEITDIKTVGDKQIINLGEVQGESSFGFFSRSARLFGATTQQAGSSSETVAQNVEISLDTLGLNLGNNEFDPSALTEVGSFDVEITFKELGGKRTETRTMTFQTGETKKTETFYLPKDMGQGVVEAEIPKLKDTIALRVYVSANNTTNFNLGQDMTYKFELSQIVHPVIDLKVVDPYGKELQENINQDLGLKLTLEDEYKFDLPANIKTFNIRTLADFMGANIEDLNYAGDNPTLSLTTQLDANNRLKVGDKTYKLNKITYNALGQEVEINGQRQKVGGYIEFATQPKIIVPTPDDKGDLPKKPEGYKRLSFHAESSSNAQDGRFENGEKLKVIDVLEGTEYTDTDLQKQIKEIKQPTPLINGRVDDNKKFLKWNPALPTAGKVADTDFWPVYLKDGGEITPGEKLPDGVFEVKVIKDDTIAADPLYGKSYGVFQGSKLARDKFPDLVAEKGHQNPKWTTEAEDSTTGMGDIEKPWTKVITKATTFKATAAEKAATQIKKEGLKAVDTTVLQGQELTEEFWHKGVALADNTPAEKKAKFEALLKEATVTDASNPARTTAEAGDKVGTLLVTFKDGSTLEVPNQKLIVKPNTVEVSFDDKKVGDDANAPRHKETVVKGKVSSTSDYPVKGAVVEIKDENNNVIGITKVIDDEGNFTAGTRELKAGEKLTASVTLPDSKLAAESTPKTVKLNADRLKDLLPIAKTQKDNFSKKQNAIIKEKLEALGTAITEAEKLVDKNGKATATDTAKNQTAIDTAVTNLENALKALTANIPPTISGPKTHEIFVGEALDLEKLVEVTDGDGADDLVVENGSNVKITAVKVEKATEPNVADKETAVADLSTIKDTVGTYKVTYTAKDKSDAKVTHEMTLTVKPRTTSAIEVTKDPNKMSYLITGKDGKAKLDLTGMTLNLVDNLGKKTKVDLTDKNVTFKVNGKEIKNGGELTLADDVHFIEVEYKYGDNTLTAQTKGVLRVGPDYDGDGKDDRTQNFDPEKIEKLVVVKQPQLDYIAKDKSEADKVFKLNLEGMIVRMTDKAGKEKLAVFNEGKFVDYDNIREEIKGLTATPVNGAKLTPQTSDTDKGHNGSKVAITGPNNSNAETDPLKVFYDANKDGKPDYGQEQKTPAPSAMARNVGENPQGTTVEGMATPGAVIKITDAQGKVLTTEPKEVKAGPDGKYTATIKPMLADGTDIKVTAKLGEMGESNPTEAKVFDDKNNNKQPDKDEGFNIAKATDIKFVDQPDLTYLVKTKDKEVTFDGKDAKGKAIYLELSYKNGDKTESKIMTLEELMKDTTHISVTPANGTKDKIGNDPANLVGKAIDVKLVKADKTATSTSTFAIEIDADGNGKADKDEKTPTPSILSARNLKDGENVETKVLVKGKPGATITIKSEDGQTDLGTGTVGDNGQVEIKLNAKQEAGTKIQAIAKLGEMKPSDPAESIVFDDLNNDGKPDGQGEVDFNNIVEMRIASDPKTMKYALASEDGSKNLDLNGLTVYVKDKNGNSGIYQYGAEANKVNNIKFKELKGDNNFKLELVDANGENPAVINDGTTLAKANDANKIKVSLVKNSEKNDTTGPLNVFVDANGNGIDDDKEKIDLTKVKDIKVISQPELNYPITEKGGKTKLDLTKMVVEVSDGVNKANFTAKELLDAKIGEGNEAKAAFKLSLVDGNDAQQAEISDLTGTELTTANDQNKVKVALANKETVNAKTDVLQVFEDLDKDGKRDTKQTPAPTELKALNVKEDKFTTITGKAQKGDTIKVYGEDGKEITTDPTTVTVGEDGTFTIKVSKDGNALPENTKIFVTAQAKDKDESPRTPVVVKADKDGNGIADEDEKTPEPDVLARNIGTDGPDGKKVPATKTTVEIKTEPKADVTIEYKDANGDTKTITDKADDQGNLTKEITPKLADGTDVKVTVKDGEKQATEKTVKVFEDLDGDKVPDTKAGQTERPAALASNIGKKPEFTTITGEAEKGATVTAKVGTEVVGTAIADKTTGRYTIEAKQNDAPIKQGVKIDVTAKLEPKSESEKQTVVVFKDTDGTGQPDSAKDFDVKKAKEMQVVASPDKMVYSNGDKLNLDGLKVLVTDVNGNKKIFTYRHADNTEFTKAGLSVDLKQGTELSSKDYNAQTAKDGHNGRKLVVTLDTTGNTQVTEAITGQTPTALTVNKNQSAQPTDVVAANQGDATVTKVKGKATKDAEIKITDDSGQSLLPKGTTIKADAKGDFTVDLNKLLNPGTKVFVTATEPGKSESPKAETPVIRDKDGNWKADTGAKLSTPVIDPIREKDEKVVVTAPTAEDKIQTIEVSDQNGKTVTLTKDPADTTGKTWKVDGSNPEVKVKEENGKIAIPVKGTLPLNDRDQIKVTFKDGENPANEAFDKAPVQKASQTPKVDPVYTGDKNVKVVDPTVADPKAKTIKVKVGDNDSMTVEKQPDGSWKVKEDPNKEVKVEDGKIVVPLDPSAKKGDVIKVSTINDSGKASPAAEVKVVDKEKSTKPEVNPVATNDTKITGKAGPNADVVITITPKDGGTPKEINAKADKDGNFSVPAEGLKDGDTIVAKATEKDKATAESAPVTVGVDKTKLINAIDDGNNALDPDKGGRNDGTPADKALEKAIEEGKKVKDNPDATQKDVNEKTKAIEDAIKEKEETDKALDELKKAKEELDKTIEDAEKDEKPDEAIEKGQDASDAADTVINNKGKDADGKDMSSEQIKDLVEKTKEENRLLRLPVIQIAITNAVNNGKSVVFTTNPGRCKVTVTIFRSNGNQETYTTETGAGGTGSIKLENPLKSGDGVMVKATRITDDRPTPDYLDNYTSTVV